MAMLNNQRVYIYIIYTLQLQTSSETVFGVVFWGLFTPQRVFGALGIYR